MLVTIIVVFAVCWAPISINNVLVAFRVIPELHLGKEVTHGLICRNANEKDKKVQVGNYQENAQSGRNSHSKNRGQEKNKLTIRYLYLENIIVSQVSSYFPIGGHSVNPT